MGISLSHIVFNDWSSFPPIQNFLSVPETEWMGRIIEDNFMYAMYVS